MVIQIDNKDGVLGIRVRDFINRKGNYQKTYTQYHYCNKEVKDQMVQLLENALHRIKYGFRA